MESSHFVINRRARIAWDMLTPDEKSEVIAKLTALAGEARERWPESGATPLPGDSSLTLLRVTASLLLYFSVEDGRIAVEDFVRQETLDRFFATPPVPAGQA